MELFPQTLARPRYYPVPFVSLNILTTFWWIHCVTEVIKFHVISLGDRTSAHVFVYFAYSRLFAPDFHRWEQPINTGICFFIDDEFSSVLSSHIFVFEHLYQLECYSLSWETVVSPSAPSGSPTQNVSSICGPLLFLHDYTSLNFS